MTQARSAKIVLALSIALTLLNVSGIGQAPIKPRKVPKFWFIARVVDTDPFTIEYVDRWSYYVEPKMDRYTNEVETQPQAQNENVREFELGDMIAGEHCNYFFMNCPPGVLPVPHDAGAGTAGIRIPPDIAINLKKLPSEYKIKYARTGMLVYYKPHKDSIVHSMDIFRDGTISMSTYYAGWIRRKLPTSELRRIERAFFDSGADKLNTSTSSEYFKYGLATMFGKNRSLQIDYSSQPAKPFIDVLDGLIATQVRNANYRITYRWRFEIRDWQYGDILPLDQAAAPGYDYITRNRARLSKLSASREFYEENKNPNGSIVNRFVYRFKGKLYHFSFAGCTDRPTGSWGCYFANPLGKADTVGNVIGEHEEWPRDLKTKLHDIPADALLRSDSYLGKAMPIDHDDVVKHRDFYTRLLGATAEFREGNYIYVHVRVWMR